MEATRLDDQFAAVRAANSAARIRLEQDLHDQETQRAAIHSEIEVLRQKLADLGQDERTLRNNLAQHANDCLEQERDIAVAALRASYESICAMQSYWLRCARLDNQIQTLWNSEPAFGTMLEAYRKVEANADEYLTTIPEIMRDAIAQTLRAEQEKLRARVAPWLDLQAQRQQLRPDHSLTLQILVAHEPGDTRIAWALPFPADDTTLSPEFAPALIAVGNAIATALGSFGKHPEWNIDDLDNAAWEGFSVVLALAGYGGTQPLATAAAILLATLLSELSLFRDIELDLRVDEIPYAVWREGRQETALPIAQEQSDVLDHTPDRPPMVELTQGWYTDDDVRAWGRREGKLSSQARRMRTLLMRMIGRGMVGGAAIPVETLWEALPTDHNNEMRRGITALIDAGILHQVSDTPKDALMVTINPAMMGDVQSLIRRETTGLWAEVINQSAPIPAA